LEHLLADDPDEIRDINMYRWTRKYLKPNLPIEQSGDEPLPGTTMTELRDTQLKQITQKHLQKLPKTFKFARRPQTVKKKNTEDIVPRLIALPEYYNCEFCAAKAEDTKFKTTAELMMHIKISHKTIRDHEPDICLHCLRVEFDHAKIIECVKSHAPIELPEDSRYTCFKCMGAGKIECFVKEEDYLAHLSSNEPNHKKSFYFCGVCGTPYPKQSRRNECQDKCSGQRRGYKAKEETLCGIENCDWSHPGTGFAAMAAKLRHFIDEGHPEPQRCYFGMKPLSFEHSTEKPAHITCPYCPHQFRMEAEKIEKKKYGKENWAKILDHMGEHHPEKYVDFQCERWTARERVVALPEAYQKPDEEEESMEVEKPVKKKGPKRSLASAKKKKKQAEESSESGSDVWG
jgi:hypothetical protein